MIFDIFDDRHQKEWEAISAAAEGAVISFLVTFLWVAFACFYAANHFGR